MTELAAGPLTRALWREVAPIITQIEALPFLRELASGTLDAHAFVTYITQDSLYLERYGRVMALLAAKATQREQTRFWAASALRAIAAEEQVHAALLADARLAPVRDVLAQDAAWRSPSPTTLGYVSYLQARVALDAYAVGVAAVLPCFWVYAHVGAGLAAQAGRMAADHPYAVWMATYGDADFAGVACQAVAILETNLATTDAAGRRLMHEAFAQACVYERRFWQAAHVVESWDGLQRVA
ncbi:MAG TPA: TenA family protein [Rhodanobacteraceae bacterium]